MSKLLFPAFIIAAVFAVSGCASGPKEEAPAPVAQEEVKAAAEAVPPAVTTTAKKFKKKKAPAPAPAEK